MSKNWKRGGYKDRERQEPSSAAHVRSKNLQTTKGRSWDSRDSLDWDLEGKQRHGDRSIRAKPGESLQLLQPKVLSEDSPHDCRPDGDPYVQTPEREIVL